jgi:hypothetical protein
VLESKIPLLRTKPGPFAKIQLIKEGPLPGRPVRGDEWEAVTPWRGNGLIYNSVLRHRSLDRFGLVRSIFCHGTPRALYSPLAAIERINRIPSLRAMTCMQRASDGCKQRASVIVPARSGLTIRERSEVSVERIRRAELRTRWRLEVW